MKMLSMQRKLLGFIRAKNIINSCFSNSFATMIPTVLILKKQSPFTRYVSYTKCSITGPIGMSILPLRIIKLGNFLLKVFFSKASLKYNEIL